MPHGNTTPPRTGRHCSIATTRLGRLNLVGDTLLNTAGGGTVGNVTYTYDASSNRATVGVLGYSHNGAHQVTTQTSSIAAYLMPQPTPSSSYTPNALNQYSQVGGSTLIYDANGNLTSDGVWTYRYDEENRLRQVVGPGTTVDYQYNPDGRRRSKSVNGLVTYYVSDGANELDTPGGRLRQYDPATDTESPL